MDTHLQRSFRWVALGAALTIPLLSSCGDDGPDRLSKAEFLKQGNAVCAASNERINAAFEKAAGGSDAPPTEAIVPILDELTDEVRGQIDGVDALEPPEELADRVDDLIEAANVAYDQMEADIEADPVAFAEDESDPFAKANAINAEIGLTECAAS